MQKDAEDDHDDQREDEHAKPFGKDLHNHKACLLLGDQFGSVINRRSSRKIVYAESILKQAKPGFCAGQDGDGDDIKPVGGFVETVSRNVMAGGADDAAAFGETDGVLGRIGVLAGFDFNESEDGAIPGDDVDFAGGGAIRGDNDTIAERAEVASREEFGAAREAEKTG
jgi:hypothetical protein